MVSTTCSHPGFAVHQPSFRLGEQRKGNSCILLGASSKLHWPNQQWGATCALSPPPLTFPGPPLSGFLTYHYFHLCWFIHVLEGYLEFHLYIVRNSNIVKTTRWFCHPEVWWRTASSRLFGRMCDICKPVYFYTLGVKCTLWMPFLRFYAWPARFYAFWWQGLQLWVMYDRFVW